MFTLAFLAPDGVVYTVSAEPWRRPGTEGDTWEAHIFAPRNSPLPSDVHSPMRPQRGTYWSPNDALEAAALALTKATSPHEQPMQTILTGSDPRLFKWATSIPLDVNWRPAAEELFTRHERWLAEGTPYSTDTDKTADYHILNERLRLTDGGYRWITVQLTRDGQRPLSAHGYYSVVVHEPEAR